MFVARRPFLRFLGLFVFAFLASSPLLAQRGESESSRLFPTVDRIWADFPDDPHRWAAMRALYEESMKRMPDHSYKASYEKSSSYQQNIGLLEQKYDLPAQAANKKEFFDRIEALKKDNGFKQQVLKKYGITELKTGTVKDWEQNAKTPEQLMREAFPYWVATLVLMWFVVRQTSRSGGGPALSASPGGGDLPHDLQVVKVTGRQYPVELDSGVVLNEKSWVESTTTFTTTPGQVITIGDQMISVAPQHSSSTTSVRKDRICLADRNGRESFWQLSGGIFDVRETHLLSRIGVRNGDNVTFLMACNHTTGQIVSFAGSIHSLHGGRFLAPWFFATLAGTAGFFLGGWSLIPRLNPEETWTWSAIGYGGLCFIGSIITAFLMAFWMGGRVITLRNNQFYKNWVPKYREFFKQYTPAVLARFR
jgi:DNA-binding transcriptional regulator YiaG